MSSFFQTVRSTFSLFSSTSSSTDFWSTFFASFDPFHVAIESLCLVVILYLLYRKPYDPKDLERLKPEEEEELIKSWKPDPLAPLPSSSSSSSPSSSPSSSSSSSSLSSSSRKTRVVKRYEKEQVVIGDQHYVNFASHNYLGLASNPTIRDKCRETIDRYGVGSCGPRGFYGTFDIHLSVERTIAEFFKAPACILYSDAIALMSSIIPAFSKRGDLIVCDSSVNFGIQQGIRLSRSNVLYFKHGDMADLERILSQVHEKDLHSGSRARLNRRFIVVEGISSHYGDVTPLPQIVRLKNKYKYRLIMDDSLAIGALGETGRGTLDHFQIDIEQCDMLCAAMDTSVASVGGFCVGSSQIVDHQRLSGAGYCFSASSPPYTGTAAIEALKMINDDPSLGISLRQKAAALRKMLASIPQLSIAGRPADHIGVNDSVSPALHLFIHSQYSSGSRDQDELQLLKIQNQLFEHDHIAVDVPQYVPYERNPPPPCLKIVVTVNHDPKQFEKLAKAIKKAASDVLPTKQL